jgi:molybdopterin-binding protein
MTISARNHLSGTIEEIVLGSVPRWTRKTDN